MSERETVIMPLHKSSLLQFYKEFMFRKNLLFCTAVLGVLILCGCNDDARIQKAIPAETDQLAREFIAALENQNANEALQLIDPDIRKDATDKIKNIVTLFKDGKAQQVKPVGVRGKSNETERLIQVSYQLYYPDKAVIASLVILEKAESRFIISARLDPMKQPLEKFYAFKLFGKSLFHYVILFFWVAIPLFTLYVLWGCVRSSVKWKWVWAALIVFSFFPIYLDWSSGRAFIRLLSVLILGATYAKQKYGPFVFAVGIPVGAIVFYFMYLFKKNKSTSTLPL